MTFSMTGFTALEQSFENTTIILELRAVNSRYLDLHFKLDDHLRSMEPIIRELISAQVNRGKIECKINVMPHAPLSQDATLHEGLIQQLVGMQSKIQAYFPDSQRLTIADILRWPGMVLNGIEGNAFTSELLFAQVNPMLTQGLQELNASRAREGEKLKTIILDRLSHIELLIAKVKPLLPALTREYQLKLENKLQETLKTIDQERLAQELVLFAQRIDVDEELTRLTAHVSEVKRIMQNNAPAGKRMDFIMQELNREANTLGSKSVSVVTSQVSMELKVLIEQMREQVQNIE